jgi:uncharacterized protein YjeT (DUF2065 family)
MLFGVLIIVIGVIMLAQPLLSIDMMKRYSESLSLQVLAVVVRLVLGVALVFYGDQSRYPLTLQALGCAAIAAAVFIAILPRDTFKQLITRMLDAFSAYIRIGGFCALVFGVFLTYAVSKT